MGWEWGHWNNYAENYMMLKLNRDRLFRGRIPTRAELCEGEGYFFFFLSLRGCHFGAGNNSAYKVKERLLSKSRDKEKKKAAVKKEEEWRLGVCARANVCVCVFKGKGMINDGGGLWNVLLEGFFGGQCKFKGIKSLLTGLDELIHIQVLAQWLCENGKPSINGSFNNYYYKCYC